MRLVAKRFFLPNSGRIKVSVPCKLLHLAKMLLSKKSGIEQHCSGSCDDTVNKHLVSFRKSLSNFAIVILTTDIDGLLLMQYGSGESCDWRCN